MAKPISGVVIWEGKSCLSSQPIVAIATVESENEKTGNVVQITIVPRDVSPLDALQTNDNSGACGNCPLQGRFDPQRGRMVDRVCYVNVGQAAMAIWRKYQRGGYPAYNARQHKKLLKGRVIRIGSYGDPAALPVRVLRMLVDLSSAHTAYSHQLLNNPAVSRSRAEALAQICMVSCETPAQHAECQRRGWRSFVVIRPDQQAHENCVECPFYSHNVQCIDCKLCDGSAKPKKSVYVIAHAKTGANLPAVQEKLQAL